MAVEIRKVYGRKKGAMLTLIIVVIIKNIWKFFLRENVTILKEDLFL